MTTAQELLDEWTTGETTGMRAKRVQAEREALEDITGQTIPRRIPEIEAFMQNAQWKGVITRKLRAAAEGSEPADLDGDS